MARAGILWVRQSGAFSYGARVNLIRSTSHDIFENIALEDWLLDHGAEFAPLLLLSVNQPCVVIGKNQVPWRECATGALRAAGIPLARRMSGGGTVYHDSGCLNYSFILPRDSYKQDEFFSVVLRALRRLGVVGEIGAHNGLFAGGRKFSGTAYCYRRQHVLHHGTLLVATDLGALRRYCVPALPQIETRAIASRPASVVNLSDLSPTIDVQTLAKALAEEAGAGETPPIEAAEIAARAHGLRGWDFVWGHTPKFELQVSGFRFQIEHGRVAACDLPEFIGRPFSREALLATKFPDTGNPAAALFQSLEGLDF